MNTHHATVIAATSLEAAAGLLPVVVSDVDTDVLAEPSLSIASVRSLIGRAQQRPVRSAVRTFVIVVNQIPVIAQNALLKLFEDPPAHAQFVVVMPRPGELIPTLRSRVLIIDQAASIHQRPVFDSASFIATPLSEQLKTVEQWVKAADHRAIDDFVLAVEYVIATKGQNGSVAALKTYLSVSQQLRQPGAAKKMLLEHLVLSLAAR